MWFFIKFCNVIQILLPSIQLYIYNTIFHEGSRQMTENYSLVCIYRMPKACKAELLSFCSLSLVTAYLSACYEIATGTSSESCWEQGNLNITANVVYYWDIKPRLQMLRKYTK